MLYTMWDIKIKDLGCRDWISVNRSRYFSLRSVSLVFLLYLIFVGHLFHRTLGPPRPGRVWHRRRVFPFSDSYQSGRPIKFPFLINDSLWVSLRFPRSVSLTTVTSDLVVDSWSDLTNVPPRRGSWHRTVTPRGVSDVVPWRR